MLTGKQKSFLRKQSHHEKPLFQVGKGGVTENMLAQINDALESREILKISVLQNCLEDKHTVAETVSSNLNAEVVQVIGNNIVLYKESTENKQIVLPK